MRILCLYLLQQIYHTSALGFGMADVTDTVGFIREDNQRDTISLLVSCFATLGLCVYSAVHLNVPRKGDSNLRVLLREFKWCVIGLFAPELILYTAWRQLASARQLCNEINKIKRDSRIEVATNDKVCPWTTVLVIMLMLLGYCPDRGKISSSYQRERMDACTRVLWFYGRFRN